MLNQFQANNQESFLFSVFVRKWPHIARYMVVLVGLLVFTKLGVAQESTEDVAESNPPQIAQEEADPAINKEDSQNLPIPTNVPDYQGNKRQIHGQEYKTTTPRK